MCDDLLSKTASWNTWKVTSWGRLPVETLGRWPLEEDCQLEHWEGDLLRKTASWNTGKLFYWLVGCLLLMYMCFSSRPITCDFINCVLTFWFVSRHFWLTWIVWVYVIGKVRVKLASCWVFTCGRNLNVAIFLDTINIFNVKLCMMLYLLNFTQSYHLQSPWLYFKVTAVLNSFNWEFYVLIKWVETLYNRWLCQVDHEYTTIFDFHTCSMEMIDIFPHLKKMLMLAFS